MQNIQISTCQNHCLEEIHVANIQNNIEIWEQNQFNPNFNQRKLIQVTSMLKNSELNSFSFNVVMPATFFGGVEESFNICLNTNMTEAVYSDNKEQTSDDFIMIKNYHRVQSIYDMNPIIDSLFTLFNKSLKNNTNEDLEILTSLIIFEMEQLSKKRLKSLNISQKMYDTSNPLNQWLSGFSINVTFNDYFLHDVTKFLH